jgi:UDP-N-acetylmuramoyl-L-alanyl-D-glutamate--2,6-diaminopimelate ligase
MVEMPKSYPVTSHTDFVQQGSTFFAFQGTVSHGLCYVKQAVKKGATTVVFAQDFDIPFDLFEWLQNRSIQIIRSEDPHLFFAKMAAQMAGNPAQKLKIFGVTGTKGKTTSVHLLAAVFKKAGYKTALLSSVYNSINDSVLPSSLTTPQADYIHQFLKVCVDQDVTHVIIEVSAQALTLGRIEGIEFDGIIMTNFAQEHLEFYNSMDEYLIAKKKILEYQKSGCPVLVNGNDDTFASFANAYISFGCICCTNETGAAKVQVAGSYDGEDLYDGLNGKVIIGKDLVNIANTYFYGHYNFSNMIGVAGLAYFLQIPIVLIESAISEFKGLLGRCERYWLANGAICFVDKAYNPLSFSEFLSTLRKMTTSRLIVVFGAGGERDASRRPSMGMIASLHADYIILTTDNPRSEDPEKIIQDILSGILTTKEREIQIILDRKQAIIHALSQAQPGDIVAVLGKGEERYQIFHDRKEPFSDIEIVCEYDLNLIHSSL